MDTGIAGYTTGTGDNGYEYGFGFSKRFMMGTSMSITEKYQLYLLKING